MWVVFAKYHGDEATHEEYQVARHCQFCGHVFEFNEFVFCWFKGDGWVWGIFWGAFGSWCDFKVAGSEESHDCEYVFVYLEDCFWGVGGRLDLVFYGREG